MIFAPRSGRAELYRVAEFLRDVEVPDRLDSIIGCLALSIIAMIKTSPEDEAPRMRHLLRLMEREE